MQDEDLLLIVRKRAERTTQIKLAGVIPVRWIEPRGILSEPGVSSLKFHSRNEQDRGSDRYAIFAAFSILHIQDEDATDPKIRCR